MIDYGNCRAWPPTTKRPFQAAFDDPYLCFECRATSWDRVINV